MSLSIYSSSSRASLQYESWYTDTMIDNQTTAGVADQPMQEPVKQDPFVIQKPDPEEDLLVWTAPNRPFKKRNREFFTTVFLIMFLVSLILFFANQFLPIAVVLALGFLTYVLASVPPEMVENKITTYGVHSAQHTSYWYEMGRYWFTKKYKYFILHIECQNFPYRMMLLFDEHDKDALEKVLDKYLIQQMPTPSVFDKAADWLQQKVPLDREEKVHANPTPAPKVKPTTDVPKSEEKKEPTPPPTNMSVKSNLTL